MVMAAALRRRSRLREASHASIAASSSAMPLPSVATVRTTGQIEAFGVEFALHAVGAGLVGLVDHEDVGDLHDAGLDRLDVVAHAGHQHHDGDLRDAGDFHFVLAHARRSR